MAKKTATTQSYTFTFDDLNILGTFPVAVLGPVTARPKLTVTDNTGYKQQFDDLHQLGGADGRN